MKGFTEFGEISVHKGQSALGGYGLQALTGAMPVNKIYFKWRLKLCDATHNQHVRGIQRVCRLLWVEARLKWTEAKSKTPFLENIGINEALSQLVLRCVGAIQNDFIFFFTFDVFYVLLWTQQWCMRFADQCILFLSPFYTVSNLYWIWDCYKRFSDLSQLLSTAAFSKCYSNWNKWFISWWIIL